MPAIDGFGFDRPTRPFDQAVGPGMVGLGEAVPHAPPTTRLRERMDLGRAGPAATAITPQRELPSVVGQHPIQTKRIEALAVNQEGDGAGHVPCRVSTIT